ncbi:MAG: TrkH family potassium uptake protein [Acutalibacteraceae bacterium]
MNYKIIRYVVGWVIIFEACFLVLPGLISLIYAENEALIFFACAAVCAVPGFLIVHKKPGNMAFYAREGFLSVAISWIVMSVIGAVPLYISGAIPSVTDALFETVSGFTTTGASILQDVEALSYGMLFWRSFTHWVGGMGVLVFMLAILPMAGGQSMYLMKAESPGPSVSKLVPNLRKSAVFLYGTYLLLTLLQTVLLATVGEMPLFDAVCSAFGTAGTGGFGVRNDSFAGYSITAQVITGVFMMLFGVNFTCYFFLWKKRFKDALRLEELRWYLIIYGVASLLILFNLFAATGDFFGHIHEVFFQTACVMTTTGFSTVNFDLWPQMSRVVMVLLMFVGACAGSTGGGMKVSRIMMLVRASGKELSRMLHPRKIKVLKMDGKAIERETIRGLYAYLICYIGIFALSVLLLSLDRFDLTTNFTAVASAINNIGPGLSAVSPAGNYAGFSVLSKFVLMFDMLAGRLEIFPLLLLFSPATWKK